MDTNNGTNIQEKNTSQPAESSRPEAASNSGAQNSAQTDKRSSNNRNRHHHKPQGQRSQREAAPDASEKQGQAQKPAQNAGTGENQQTKRKDNSENNRKPNENRQTAPRQQREAQDGQANGQKPRQNNQQQKDRKPARADAEQQNAGERQNRQESRGNGENRQQTRGDRGRRNDRQKEGRKDRRDSRNAENRELPETLSETGESFTPDFIPSIVRSHRDDDSFGIIRRNEDEIIDKMPPDPTLDAVFADPSPVEEEPADPETTTEVVGIHFPQGGKVYWFAPAGTDFAKGDYAIVETARGTELGEVAIANRRVSNDGIVPPLKEVLRKATEADLKHAEENRSKEGDALKVCQTKVDAHKLSMKLVGAQYTFDNAKLIFYFTAASRVDFRELVKDLASTFHTRIELRQIGIRDEAKMIGGRGVCGRKLCCSGFLPNFAQVSIKMAKDQGLSINSSKISGNCGRLMCCLRFESSTYEQETALMPPPESVVETPDGRGTVTEIRPVGYTLKVKLDDKPDQPPRLYNLESVKVLKCAAVRRDDSDDSSDEIPEDIQ